MTSRSGKNQSNRKVKPTLIPFILIGIGLILLGTTAFFLLVMTNAPAKTPEAASNDLSTVPMDVDFPAPELRLADLNGDPVALADFRGQWVLLNNWATWCPPCKAEMPTLQAFHDAHNEQNFTVLAVDMGEPVEKVARFVEEYQLTFPVLPDPEERVYAAFRNISLPTSWVVDPQGQVRLTWTGAISREMLEKYVTPLLEE